VKLPPVIVLILGVIGGGLQLIQEYAISMSAQAHSIVAFAIMVVIAMGVVPLSPAALRLLIPAQVAAVLTSVAGILVAVQQTFGVSHFVHGLILVVLSIIGALGIVPAIAPLETARADMRQALRTPRPGSP
jgi:hypothetical protein